MSTEILEQPKVGRKTKYNTALCQELVDMCAEGKTLEHFCVKHGITTKTARNWAERYEDFADALDLADKARKAWISELIVRGMTGTIELESKLAIKLYDQIYKEKSPAAENVLRDINKPGSDLSHDERQRRLELLKEKLLETALEVAAPVAVENNNNNN